jgi:flagellar M-ring protein FliF
MNGSVTHFLDFIGSLPFSKKISIAFTLILVIAGFALMFLWANQENYQVLFNNISPQDGGTIVTKLKEQNVPYRVESNGTTIMVPAEKVYELRLTLAGDGLPNGGSVGFEIFDNPDFRTTKFVQELNYRRALQGELARTINLFKEVKSSAVFLVIPKDSLFMDEKKPSSASIQLDLNSRLPSGRIAAIVHLVANAVEGLESNHVTVVDTKGRVIFKGETEDDTSSILSNTKLDYKRNTENEIKDNVQSMLEAIVGPGKAIVRVSAEIDFNKIVLNQEEYDPSTTVVRSKRNFEETMGTAENAAKTTQPLLNQRSGVMPSSNSDQKTKSKKDAATNYEINKTTREIIKPAGTVKRLSVAAVIDGTYKLEKLKDGTMKKVYVPRSEDEMRTFEEIVKKAMGYSEDREDKVSARCIPFSDSMPVDMNDAVESSKFSPTTLLAKNRKTIVNLILVVLAFFLIVKPLLKSVKGINHGPAFEGAELPPGTKGYVGIPESEGMNKRERILEISNSNPEKTREVIKGWIGEEG